MAVKKDRHISEREHDILHLLTRQYIRTAAPIASADIAKILQGSLSAASIRNILAELSSKGYLQQPHTSAGRIPTQKAYRLFVNNLYEEHAEILEDSLMLGSEHINRLQRYIAQTLHAVTGIVGQNDLFPLSGFEYLFREPEFSEHDTVIQFGRFLDNMPCYHEQYMKKLNGKQLCIVIGNENPSARSENISVVVSPVQNSYLFFVAGSTRMDYEKIIHLLISG